MCVRENTRLDKTYKANAAAPDTVTTLKPRVVKYLEPTPRGSQTKANICCMCVSVCACVCTHNHAFTRLRTDTFGIAPASS